METLNIQLANVHNLVCRIIKEFQKSQSANSSMLSTHDLTRAKTFMSAIRTTVAQMKEPAYLDLPETDPMKYPLRELPALLDIENEVMHYLSTICKTLAVELHRSQSSRISSGLNKYDRARCLSLVKECEDYITNFAEKVQPLDLVESSPRAPLQGPGLNDVGVGGSTT